MKIIPAILAKSYEEFESMIRKIEPYTDLVHLDIADGEFVSSKTIGGCEELKKINTKLNFEVHLMVSKPEDIIDKWLETKAIRYLIHWESTEGFKNLIERVHKTGKEFGGVLNPETDYNVIRPYVNDLEVVQFMTVNPGFYGGGFVEGVLDKISEFHKEYPGKAIAADGGIHSITAQKVVAAGANTLILGSHIFYEDRDLGEALKELNV